MPDHVERSYTVETTYDANRLETSSAANRIATAVIVPTIPETLPEGFTRLSAATLEANVNGGRWIVTADERAPLARRYWLQHFEGDKPESLRSIVGFYAPDLAQARLTLCGNRRP